VDLLKRLHQAKYFSLLADECTDISTIEELSVVIHWVENGLPEEHFIELVPLRKADASTIYETLTDCMKKKGLVIGNIIGMGQQLFLASTMEFKQEFTSLNFCALPLPSLATGLCSSYKQYSRYQTCLHNTTLEILSLFTQMGWMS